MDHQSIVQREKMTALQEILLSIERDRIGGARYYSADEVDAEMEKTIQKAFGDTEVLND